MFSNLKKFLDLIKISKNIEFLKKNLTEEIALTFGADICLIYPAHPRKNDFIEVGEEDEYIVSSKIKSQIGVNIGNEAYLPLKKVFLKKRKIFIPDINVKNLKYEQDFIQTVKKLGIKSLYAFPIVYKKVFYGTLTINFIEKTKKLSKQELEFLNILLPYIKIALNEQKISKTLKRETLLKKAISLIKSSYRFDIITESFMKDITEIFDADRAVFKIYDRRKKTKEKEWIISYISKPDVVPFEEIPITYQVAFSFVDNADKADKVYFVEDIRNSMTKRLKDNKELLDQWYHYIDKGKIKTDVIVNVWKQKELDAYFAMHYTKKNFYFSNSDLELLNTLAKQIEIAFNQAELYKSISLKIKREKLLREITETIRSSLDIEKNKLNIITEIGKELNADSCFICEIGEKKGIFAEYRSSSNIKPLKKTTVVKKAYQYWKKIIFDPAFKDGTYILSTDLYVIDYNLQNTPVEKYLQQYNIKTFVGIPIAYREKLYGALIMQYNKKQTIVSEEEKSFLKTLTYQIGLAFHQADLYSLTKEQADREALAKNQLQALLDSIPYLAWLKDDKGVYLTANKIFAQSADKTVEEIIGTTDYEVWPKKYAEKYRKDDFEVMKWKEGLAVEEAACYHGIVRWTEVFKAPLFDKNKKAIGTAGIARDITSRKQELDELIESKKIATEANERSTLLREITETIRSSLNIEENKLNIVTAIGKALNASRCFIYENGEKKGIFAEYKSSSKLKSLKKTTVVKEAYNYWEKIIFDPAFKDGTYILNTKQYVLDNNLQNTPIEKYFKEYAAKTFIGIPISYGENIYGALIIQYNKKQNIVSEEEKFFLKTITYQIGLAFHHSALYSLTKEQADREALIRTIIDTVRSTLNLSEIKNKFVTEVGKAFHADRCYFRNFCKKTNQFLSPSAEYLSSPDILSLKKISADTKAIKYFIENAQAGEFSLIVENTDEFIKKYNLEGSPTENYLKSLNIKSDYAFIVWDRENEFILLILHYTKKVVKLSKEDKKTIEILVKEAKTAIEQSELYEKQRKTAEQEILLREIISDIKLTRDLNEAYQRLLQKLAKIFNLNRALFLESSIINPDELFVKCEYVNKNTSLNNIVFPQVCINEFLSLVKKMEPLVVNDIEECGYEHNPEEIEFLKKHRINALLTVPLVKYNREVKVLGFIVLCSEKTRIWTNDEINLIKLISYSIVSVIWEITKFIEIENLRNSFISTLTHDFQIPLVGEKAALEYLLNYLEKNVTTSKQLIKELFQNNLHITTLLNKSIDIYNYESGKKQITTSLIEISKILDESLRAYRILSEAKHIELKVYKPDKKFLIQADKAELLKVFNTLIENALENSPEHSKVHIGLYEKEDNVIIYIKDNGPGIPEDLRGKLFNLYEMSIALERKIGGGTGLLLAKYIVEAHNGSIWFETELNRGTVFYFSLPLAYGKQ